MNPVHAAGLVAAAGFAFGAVGSLTAVSNRGARLICAVGAIIGCAGAIGSAASILITGAVLQAAAPQLLAPAGGLAFRLDPLGAFFLLLVGVGGLPAALYGFAYMAGDEGRLSLGTFGAIFNLFLLSLCGVACAGNIITFLMAWELMALTSYLLVMTDGANEETRTAAVWYFGTTELGFLALVVMFLLLVPAGGGSTFADLSAGAATLSPALRGAVFVLAVIGFGSKAGLAPLHVWPPRAKAAAPSHVSALMSGVMINFGIYGLLRVIFDVMGGGPAWWGIVLLAIGSLSALLGVLGALVELDLKRLLALSTVENAGIILVALGAGIILHAVGLPALAGLAIAAALFHTVNHTCFKGLLFLQAGSVVRATGTRNLERMGGLIKKMPQTALLFLIGAAAIAALPPLNGFASEWLIFQALLGGTQIPRPGLAIGLPVAAGALALSSGLAAAVFVKAFGIGFLAMPRSDAAQAAHEAPASMRVAGWLLAGCCLLLGVGATRVLPSLSRIVNSMAGWRFDIPPAGLWMVTPKPLGQFSPVLLAILLAVAAAATAVAVSWVSRQPLRRVDTWGCGRLRQTPRMEYTASAFAEPLRRVFAELYRPSRDLAVNVHPESPNFVQSMTFTSDVRPLVEPLLYTPVLHLWRAMAFQVRRLQAGSVHLYLGYMTAALLAALAFAWWLR